MILGESVRVHGRMKLKEYRTIRPTYGNPLPHGRNHTTHLYTQLSSVLPITLGFIKTKLYTLPFPSPQATL